MEPSPFEKFWPQGMHFENPNEDKYKYKQYLRFAVYKLPTVLERHSSETLLNHPRHAFEHRKLKKSKSIVLDNVGVVKNALCKEVSFSPVVNVKTYKDETP